MNRNTHGINWTNEPKHPRHQSVSHLIQLQRCDFPNRKSHRGTKKARECYIRASSAREDTDARWTHVASLGWTDYFQVDMLGFRSKFVTSGVKKSLGSSNLVRPARLRQSEGLPSTQKPDRSTSNLRREQTLPLGPPCMV